MANTLKFGDGKWATGKDTVLAFNDENNNFKPLPFSFSRASSANVVNKDGLIETVGVGEPRIDFKDNTKGALLLEPQRTNLVAYSEDFSQSYWSKPNTNISNSVISPDGGLNGTKYTLDVTNGRSQISRSIFSVGTLYTISVFVKYDSVKYFYISNAGAGAYRTVFDIENGIIVSNGASIISSKIENYGNGWYRCSSVFTAAYSTLYLKFSPNTNGAVFTNTTDFSYIYGAQLEQGSYATSYIPTSGSAVTKNADVVTGGGNVNIFNSLEGILEVSMSSLANDSTNKGISISDGTANNIIEIFYTNVSNAIQFKFTVGGVDQVNELIYVTDITDTAVIKFKYKVNDFGIKIDGVEEATDTSGSVPSANTFNVMNLKRGSSNTELFAKVNYIKYYNNIATY